MKNSKINKFADAFASSIEVASAYFIMEIVINVIHEKSGISKEDLHEEFYGITQQIKAERLNLK
jgi:uncharacterized ion transporter superfamily protein YfcC